MRFCKCDRGCSQSYFINQMMIIEMTGAPTVRLCPDCAEKLYAHLRLKNFGLKTHGEAQTEKRKAARATAWQAGAGW